MKTYSVQERTQELLHMLRTHKGVRISGMAEKLSVTERTIRNDLAGLEKELAGIASVSRKQGICSLDVTDPAGLDRFASRMAAQTDQGLPEDRMEYLFETLLRAEAPVISDEIAYELYIGRTTLMADLSRLRRELAPWNLKITGRCGRGLVLEGREIDIRRCLLAAYPHLILPAEDARVDRYCRETGLSRRAAAWFRRFAGLALERIRTGHPVEDLAGSYPELAAGNGSRALRELAGAMSLPENEKTFLALAAASLRTPGEADRQETGRPDPDCVDLTEEIMDRIHRRTGVRPDLGDLREAFLYHVMQMCRRLRYGIAPEGKPVTDLFSRYPAAGHMAEIAAETVADRTGLAVSGAELQYLGVYFGTWAAAHEGPEPRGLRIAVICREDPAVRRLLGLQLAALLDSSTRMTFLEAEECRSDAADRYDAVLTTEPLQDFVGRVIMISEIIDRENLTAGLRSACRRTAAA